MAIKDAFTAEEWRVVAAAPFLVGMYMVEAAPSGLIVLVREMMTAEKAVGREAVRSDGLPLIKEIAADLKADVLIRDVGRIRGATDTQAQVLADLSHAVALVGRLAPAMDSAFRAWLYRLAEKLAGVAAEPRTPGPGRLVSDAEAAALATLAETLGVPQ